jgi:hypothetical protein
MLRQKLRELLRGCCAFANPNANLTAARLLRELLHQMLTMLQTLILLRGWCLSKMFRFSISENRRHSCSIERVKLCDD